MKVLGKTHYNQDLRPVPFDALMTWIGTPDTAAKGDIIMESTCPAVEILTNFFHVFPGPGPASSVLYDRPDSSHMNRTNVSSIQ